MATIYCVIGQGWMEDEAENTTACNFVSEDQSTCRRVAEVVAEEHVLYLRGLEDDIPEDERTNFRAIELTLDRWVVMDTDTDTWHSSFEVQEVHDHDLPYTE